MEECPICHANLNGADICRRCRAELGHVKEIERRGEAFAGEAVRALVLGETIQALRLLRRAHALHAAPEIRQLLSKVEANVGIETEHAYEKRAIEMDEESEANASGSRHGS
jgi:predicted amidophosphoribosyltransferase